MHTDSLSATATRRRVGLIAGLSASAAVVATVVAGSPAFATDDAVVASAPAKIDNTMWALIARSGGVAQSDLHVLTSEKLTNTLDGQVYRVTFDRDIRDCVYLATPTASSAADLVNADTGIAIKQNRSFETRKVLEIVTKDSQPVPVCDDPSSFSLLVECGR